MLAQGTVCNRATFFGNGLQVANCNGLFIVGKSSNDDSLALALYRKGHQDHITLRALPHRVHTG